MKKTIILVLFIFVFSTIALATPNIQPSQSIDWARTLSRNGSYDSADCAVYNPAATAILKDGLYFNFSNMFLIPMQTITVNAMEKDYESNTFYPLIPNMQLVFKKDIFAAFLNVGIVGGGGGVNYKDGFPGWPPVHPVTFSNLINFGKLNAYSAHLGITLGVALSFLDNFLSFSVGVRLIYSWRSVVGEATYLSGKEYVDADFSATGLAPIFGLNFRITKEFNIGIRGEFETPLKYKTKINDNKNFTYGLGPSFTDGNEEKINFPALLGIGIEYKIIPDVFTVSVSFTYYFIQYADKGLSDQGLLIKGYDDDYKNAFDIALGIQWRIVPKFVLSLGFMYTKSGGNKDTYSPWDADLDFVSIASGFKWSLIENLDLVFSFGGGIFIKNSDITNSLEFKRKVINIGLGICWKIL